MSYKIELGQLIDGRFLIKGIIGMGGSGAVYSAWHEIMHIPLAIKIVDVSSTDEETIKRIERECSIGGKLSGTSGVVRVLDALRKDHHLLIVMDYIQVRQRATPGQHRAHRRSRQYVV